MDIQRKVTWQPHEGPQTLALQSNEFEILYGGARGGGKTTAGFAWLLYDIAHPKLRALVIRKTSDDLSDWLDRANQFYSKLAGITVEIVGRPAEVRFSTGALFRTGHLRDDNAYEKYQGHEYHRILVEELTQIPSEERYLKLISSCRSSCPDLAAQIFCTTNPGGPGHSWVKKRFIDVGPPSKPFTDPDTGRNRIFIPAKIADNPALMANDPNYLAFLNGLPEPLRSAWKDGNWDIFVGQYFKHWDRRTHVVEPFEIPKNWKRYRAMDYGSQAPSAVTWWAVNEQGKAFCYRELYASDLTYEELALRVKAMTPADEVIEYTVADPSITNKREQDGRTFYTGAELMARSGLSVVGGDNRRIEGWRRISALLKYSQIAWFSTCVKSIETIPALIHDLNKPEDVDTDCDDHIGDTVRYFVMSRPMPAAKPEEEFKPLTPEQKVQRWQEKRRKQIERRQKGQGYDPVLGHKF